MDAGAERSAFDEGGTGASIGGDAAAEGGGSFLRDAGGLLRDAGHALVDAGESVRDGGADAAAQAPQKLAVSGSRIEMRVSMQKGADGSRYGWYPQAYDTARGEDCYPSLAADGKLRCLPSGVSSSGGYFADSACTKRMTILFKCSAAPKYFRDQVVTDTSCSAAGQSVFASAGSYSGTLYAKNGATCSAISDSLAVTFAASYDYYLRGDEIAPSAFVEFKDDGYVMLE